MRQFCPTLTVPILPALTPLTVVAGEFSPPDGLFNVSLTELGATAKGSGSPFNKDWPPNGTLVPGIGGGGTIFGAPLVGGRVDISLPIPVDIATIEVVPRWHASTPVALVSARGSSWDGHPVP